MAEIEIEIDGKTFAAQPNQTVIQVADAAGIYIPRFCYHRDLSIPANCRMCLVDVEKSPKALPACATPVMAGMKVWTKSAKTIAAQRAVMEFLLINHPLDCPICDQGGECELQDLAIGYGSAHSHYDECKRAVADEDLGPLIASDMTRCIQCTRCVRFGDEVAGFRQLGVMNRSEDEAISTYVKRAMTSEVSGNIIDLCPVGALTSKPYRFTARPWELDQAASIGPHDCIGANINVHTRYGKVMRVVNHTSWLADRDRFSYTGLYHPERLEEPMMKMDGQWQAVEWQQAFEFIANQWRDVIAEHGADKIGALASPNSTLEEFYLLQKLMRALGSSHIDHRLREVDVKDQADMPAFPGLSMPINDLAQCDAIILIGSNIQKEQPLAALQLRKATLKGAAIIAINAVDYDFHFPVMMKKIVAPHQFAQVIVEAGDEIKQQLLAKQKICVLLGAQALHHPQASLIRYLSQQLAKQMGAQMGLMTDGANSAGAWLAGAIPHRHAGGEASHHEGLAAQDMLHKARKAYLLMNVEPDLDCANAVLMQEALKQAKSVVALSLYRNPVLDQCADVILPMAAFTETAGTFINVSGEWQSFTGVAKSFASSRPAWKILRVLANFLHVDGFDYASAEEVKHEAAALIHKKEQRVDWSLAAQTFLPCLPGANKKISRIGDIPLYAIDSIVRHAVPLQKMQDLMDPNLLSVRMHPETAGALGLQEGEIVRIRQQASEIELPLLFDRRIALESAWIAGGIAVTAGLGELFGEVEIS